ncbi:MAG: PAS domain-containing protein [Verrucomicrobiae bacterium]
MISDPSPTSRSKPTVTGREARFAEDEVIVSKTDLKGAITYANDVFVRISGYTEAELLGQPHNILRHPAMPRCVFQLLWTTIQGGQEIFAYVLNLAKTGDEYWVFAHVTPSYDLSGRHIGYHSNRRVPHPEALAKVRPLYAALLQEEARHASHKDGTAASFRLIEKTLADSGLTYSQFVFGLCEQTKLENLTR